MEKTIKELLKSKDLQELIKIDNLLSEYKQREIEFMVNYCRLFYVSEIFVLLIIIGIILYKQI